MILTPLGARDAEDRRKREEVSILWGGGGHGRTSLYTPRTLLSPLGSLNGDTGMQCEQGLFDELGNNYPEGTPPLPIRFPQIPALVPLN